MITNAEGQNDSSLYERQNDALSRTGALHPIILASCSLDLINF